MINYFKNQISKENENKKNAKNEFLYVLNST